MAEHDEVKSEPLLKRTDVRNERAHRTPGRAIPRGSLTLGYLAGYSVAMAAKLNARTFDFTQPCKITDENIELAQLWLDYSPPIWTRDYWTLSSTRNFVRSVVSSVSCPECGSYLVHRKYCEREYDEKGNLIARSQVSGTICPFCQRATVARKRPAEDNPPVAVMPYQPDWVCCPGCQKRFTYAGDYSWDGERHRTCGQRLIIQPIEIPLTGSAINDETP
jgi:hypothetical protein